MLPGTNWTPYMLAVSQQNGALKENGKSRDNVAILDILTSIYADFNGDFDVLKFVTSSNTLDMTAMGKHMHSSRIELLGVHHYVFVLKYA